MSDNDDYPYPITPTVARILAVECPKCDVPPGELCDDGPEMFCVGRVQAADGLRIVLAVNHLLRAPQVDPAIEPDKHKTPLTQSLSSPTPTCEVWCGLNIIVGGGRLPASWHNPADPNHYCTPACRDAGKPQRPRSGT